METATKTNPADRELTPTEIQISIAQIQDRMMRVAKAQDERFKWLDSEIDIMEDGANESEPQIQSEMEKEKTFEDSLKRKYDIPEGVFLFSEGLMACNVSKHRPYISAFVRGGLTLEQCDQMIFRFEELEECDYGWIFVESPMWFYSEQGVGDIDAVLAEIRAIGTRSKKKVRNLPAIGLYADDMPTMFDEQSESILLSYGSQSKTSARQPSKNPNKTASPTE